MYNMHEMNLRTVDLNLLHTLQALLLEQNVTRAAAKIGLSQPATSHALNRLRGLFDDPLLERKDGALRRTAFASQLMPRLDAALRAARAVFVPETDFNPKQVSGFVTLAATEYVSALILPTFLQNLQSDAPGVDVRVILTDKLSVAEVLQSGRADLALGVFERYAPGFRSEILFEDDFVLLARSGHPILNEESLTVQKLANYDWVLVSAFGDAAGPVDDALALFGVARRVRLTVPNFLQAPHVASETDLVVAFGRRLAMMSVDRWALGWRELPLAVRGFTTNMLWSEQRSGDRLLQWVRARIGAKVVPLNPPPSGQSAMEPVGSVP